MARLVIVVQGFSGLVRLNGTLCHSFGCGSTNDLEKPHEERSEPTPCPEVWLRFFEEVNGERWLM